MTYDLESLLLGPVSRYFQRKGYRWQQPELGFYEYRFDLFAYSRVADQTMAVELKLNKWRKALKQALLYQLCADHVFVAMPASSAARVDRAAFAEHGVGIVAVSDNGRCSTLLEAGRSDAVNPEYRASYIRCLLEETHG